MKPSRVAAPGPATSDWTAAITADCAVVTTGHEAAPDSNILERLSAINAEIQDTAIEAEVGILARRFKIEVMSER
jgi:hypothetical protein